MADPAVCVQEYMVSALRKLKAGRVPIEVISRYTAMVEGASVCVEFTINKPISSDSKQEGLCCFVAVSQKSLELFGDAADEERVLPMGGASAREI